MSLSSIEFRHLRYFVAVVEQRSFRGAALRLHVSQPPLTRQIHQLEEALGVGLLIRKPRGIELTDAGSVFFEEARNILLLIEQAATRSQLAGQGQLGRLDVGIFGSAVFGTIPTIIQEFRRRHPNVEVVLHNMDRVDQVKALRERRITVGFNRFFANEPDLSWEVILSERMSVALHHQHRLAGAANLTLSQISGEPLVLYPRTPRPSFIDQMLRLFHKQGLTPQVSHEVDDVVTAVALVSGGIGLSLVTESACNLKLPGVVYIPLRPSEGASFDLCMIRRTEDESPLLEAFRSTVHDLRDGLGRPRRGAGRAQR